MLNPPLSLSPGDYARKEERFTSVSTHELQRYTQYSLNKLLYLEINELAINFKCIMFGPLLSLSLSYSLAHIHPVSWGQIVI